ncbi:MAG: glycoside hydrolase family 28 protein [Anaerolineae bacterium]|nr:glycoside hydrolase family 28 protein [Anaerolineae bacterium]
MTQTTPSAFNIRDFGALGDGQTRATAAIQAALDACAEAGGGTVVVPAGMYLTGALFLHSHQTLFLDAGATLLGSEDPADYPLIEHTWEGVSQRVHAPLIGGRALTTVALTGRGTVNGRGQGWWQRVRDKTLEHPRPRLVSFAYCDNVLIEGCTFTNSPSWTLHPFHCENVTINGITIANPADSPNTDGINPESCRNVHITNCHIDVGDDCVTIKAGVEDEDRERLSPCENITVANCTMVHGHGGVVIGSETSGDVRNVVIANCVFRGTDRGIRLKSRRGRGGVVEDIRVTNVVMQDVLCPFIVNLYYGCGAWGTPKVEDKSPWPVDEGTPRFRRIHFSHVTARDVQYAAAYLYGLAEMYVEDVSFEDVLVMLALDGGEGSPAMAPGISPMRRAGFHAHNVRGLRLHNVEIRDQLGPAVVVSDAADVEISGGVTHTLDGSVPVITLDNVAGARIHGCKATEGTGVFLHLSGANTRDVVLSGNDLYHVAQPPVSLAKGVGMDAVRK